ncbi:hypothetical protein [Corynebacterium pacaense]|uniref:hypothetical protein n=1 Tax=Corynebacterium pacaense TaxID=1816684 RepID=UPI0015C47E42|nr:hypothetical protein [Corynebacterium pacaense]
MFIGQARRKPCLQRTSIDANYTLVDGRRKADEHVMGSRPAHTFAASVEVDTTAVVD